MHIFKEKHSLQQQVQVYKEKGLSIGFVPTMGALHEGHLALIKQALQVCDKVVVSIFVNPTQFDNESDLKKYPRNLKHDVKLLSQLSDEIIIFSPEASVMYGDEVSSEEFYFDGLEHQMEGKFRKDHFNGVGTIVKKLFLMIEPQKAFFGEKDFQQLQIIKKLVEKQNLPVEVIGCPIEREVNGLARSSRNERLSPEDRQNAAFIYQVLQEVQANFGTKNANEVNTWVQSQFQNHPFLKLEYFEIADTATLMEMQEGENNKQYRAFIAAYVGDIRLIDNIALK